MSAASPAASSLAVDELPAYQIARRQKIIDAALEMLEAQDYDQIQIRDVAIRAGFALGTVYRYFSSKEHLYAAVIQHWGSGFGKATARKVADKDPLKRLEARMRQVLLAFDGRPQFFRAVTLLHNSSDANATAHIGTFRTSIEGMVRADLAELDPEGAHDDAILVWAVLTSLLNRVAYFRYPMSDAYRVLDRFMEMLRMRFATAEATARD